jgi:predicted nucleic acid-binding protein
MPGIVFDTSIFIAYKPQPADFPAGFRMSAVVLQELTAGAADKSELQKWDAARLGYEKAGVLPVPNGEDWWLAGKVLNSLLRGMKSKARGKTPRLHPDEKQRLIRDALIARTTKRAGAILATNNVADFLLIKPFCNVRIRSGSDYFGY